MFMKVALRGMAVAAGLAAAAPALAQEMTFFRIGSGSAGGTYYPIAGLIANSISSPPGARSCEDGGPCGVPGMVAIAQSSNGSAANVTAVSAGSLEAGLTESAVAYFAYNGTGDWEGNQKPNIRVIANLFPETLHLVLPADAELENLAALEGMRVGIGQAGSGTQLAVLAILETQGITIDNIEEAELNISQSAERLADGQLDAFFYTAGAPASGVVQLDSTAGMQLYNFSPEEQEAANGAVPYYIASTLPAGTYESQTEDVTTLAVQAILVTSAEQDEEVIHDVTQALWADTSRRLLDNGHPKGRDIRAETALLGIDALELPLHPGAERFYREAGMIE